MARAKTPSGVVTEPLQPPKQRRDWTARARGTAMDALRYSQFVSLMKRALPIAAAAILAAVIVYSLLPRASDRITVTAEKTGVIQNDLTMGKPKLTGTDDEGNPYVVTAEKAVQDLKSPHHVHLTKMEADMTTADGRWMNTTSARGYFDMDVGLLNLEGGIAFYSDSGYELHTEKLNIEMRKGLFHGPVPVNGHGPFGAMRSDRFEFNRVKQALVMLGDVHTTIMPAAMRTKSK